MVVFFRLKLISFYNDVNSLRLVGSRILQCSHHRNHTAAKPLHAPRTGESRPALHTKDQQGLYYTLSPEVLKKLFAHGGLPKKFETQSQTFCETSVMIREYALEAIDIIKKVNLKMPPAKLLFYGHDGVGKTLSLAHVTHFLAEDGWLLLHVPWAVNWRRRFQEVTASTTVPGNYDHPLDAAVWLQHFRSQNASLLNSLQLETSRKYEWSRREITEEGAPLTEIIELGISRARFASDCVMAITNELKLHATNNKCKIAFIADGINTLFCSTSRYLREDRSIVDSKYFTLYQAFLHLLNNDWKNGVIVGSIDRLANHGLQRESHLPRYLLGKHGWETLDPFIPLLVSNYNDLEMRSIIDYYSERNWLQSPYATSEVGRKELAALSGHNPYSLMNICASL